MTVGYESVFALDDEALKCPYEHFRRARSECPVSFGGPLGFWVVSDHEHVMAVLRDAQTFSTKYMLGPQVSAEWQQMIDMAAATEEGRARLGEDYGKSPRKTLLFADPPEHTRHRRLITRALSAGAIASWEPRVRETAEIFVNGLEKEPEVEFVSEFATRYTMTVIADILGLPRDQVPQMLEWTRGFNSMVGNPNLTDDEVNALVDVRLGFDIYFDEQLAQRGSEPSEDLIGRVVELNAASETPLSRDELLMVLQLTMVGGSDTSSTALSKMVEHLARHPAEWTRLRDDPAAIPGFVEEMMRTESPVQGMFRYVTRNTELGGQQLSEGDMVWVSLAAANRDPAVFTEPDDKDMTRQGSATDYLSFGGGPHLCPGAALTRMELRVVLEALTRTFTAVHPVGEPAGSVKSFLFYGPAQLRVRFETT